MQVATLGRSLTALLVMLTVQHVSVATYFVVIGYRH